MTARQRGADVGFERHRNRRYRTCPTRSTSRRKLIEERKKRYVPAYDLALNRIALGDRAGAAAAARTRLRLLREGDAQSPHRRYRRSSKFEFNGARESRGPCFEGHARSTIGDTGAILAPGDLLDFTWLLVPRGGIEPPTRGFSVYFLSSEAVRLPLGTSVKTVWRSVKAAAVRHN